MAGLCEPQSFVFDRLIEIDIIICEYTDGDNDEIFWQYRACF